MLSLEIKAHFKLAYSLLQNLFSQNIVSLSNVVTVMIMDNKSLYLARSQTQLSPSMFGIRKIVWAEKSKRWSLVNKLILLIPGEICYRPELQPSRNYEKNVKMQLVYYYFVNQVSPLFFLILLIYIEQ